MQDLVIKALEAFTLVGADGWQIKEPDLVQFVSPAISHGAMNTVVRARFLLEEIDARISQAFQPYEKNRVTCWWMFGPNSVHIKELEMRLATKGFQLHHEAFGLMCAVNQGKKFSMPPRVSVEQVDLSSLDDYLRASRDGAEPTDGYRNYFRWIMEKHGRDLEIFLSRVDGEPAGTGLLQYLGAEGANMVSGYVRPKFRGLGAYQALIHARLQRLQQRKIPNAVVLAMANTSAPILLRQGFQKVCELRTLEKVANK